MTRFIRHKSMQRCILLLLTGAALHLYFGPLSLSFLQHPWDIVLAVNYFYLLVVLYFFSDRLSWVRHLYSRSSSIVSLSALLILVLIMGIVPQQAAQAPLPDPLGFSQMTSSWIFGLFLFDFTTIMGLLTIKQLHHWRTQRIVPLLLHLATFIILVAGVFGSGAKQRMRLALRYDEPVHHATCTDGKKVGLPFTVTLQNFSLKEYAPRIVLQSDSIISPQYIELESSATVGVIDDWQIECIELLDTAFYRSDHSDYIPMHHIGATTAAFIRAHSLSTGKSLQGWVSCGSSVFPSQSLVLTPDLRVTMLPREPKEYHSQVLIQHDGQSVLHDIRVNSPACIGAWHLYQYSYDVKMGRWSRLSVLEIVHDDWWLCTKIALWMLLSVSLLMCFTGITRRKHTLQ